MEGDCNSSAHGPVKGYGAEGAARVLSDRETEHRKGARGRKRCRLRPGRLRGHGEDEEDPRPYKLERWGQRTPYPKYPPTSCGWKGLGGTVVRSGTVCGAGRIRSESPGERATGKDKMVRARSPTRSQNEWARAVKEMGGWGYATTECGRHESRKSRK